MISNKNTVARGEAVDEEYDMTDEEYELSLMDDPQEQIHDLAGWLKFEAKDLWESGYDLSKEALPDKLACIKAAYDELREAVERLE